MAQPVFDHEGPFTERDFLALAPGTGHVELVEGTLLVGPGPGPAHEKAVAAVRTALERAVPEGLRVLGPVPLRVGHDCVLVPDLLVARAAAEPDVPAEDAPEESDDAPRPVLDCADVLMVVDVVDGTHGITQRSFKPQLYARSRIPYAVLIDSDAPFGTATMLISGRYHEFARAGAGGRLVLEEPFPVEVELDGITSDGPPAAQ